MNVCGSNPEAAKLAGKIRPGNRALIAFLSVLLLLSIAPDISLAALRIGDVAPSTNLSGVKGERVQIPESFRGKVAILHFWQIGCSSCKLEMPAMDVLYKKYRGKGLVVLAINVGQKTETVRLFSRELGVSYPLLADPDEKGARLFGVTDVPRTYVIDRKGIVRYRIFGGASPEMLKKLILSLL